MNGSEKSRDELARQSRTAWSRLFHTVEQLDRRRHDAFDLTGQMRRHARGFLLAGGLLVLGTTAALLVAGERLPTAAQRRRRNRWLFLRRVWRHPDRALRAERRAWVVELARSVLLALATTVVTLPLRRAVERLFQPSPVLPEGSGQARGESTPTR